MSTQTLRRDTTHLYKAPSVVTLHCGIYRDSQKSLCLPLPCKQTTMRVWLHNSASYRTETTASYRTETTAYQQLESCLWIINAVEGKGCSTIFYLWKHAIKVYASVVMLFVGCWKPWCMLVATSNCLKELWIISFTWYYEERFTLVGHVIVLTLPVYTWIQTVFINHLLFVILWGQHWFTHVIVFPVHLVN